MRKFKRLFPVFLVTILLAGWTMAQAAGAAGVVQCQGAGISKTQPIPGYSHAPGPLRLDFGTVVRDTADEHSIEPGKWEAPRYGSLWNSVFTWSWFSLLISR
ncbi:hypothetical protein FJY68_02500 [candidate division WOR-3 bacterium]|uniref:Secreted protein n=1 Tax=candidate division WOR-3 bacterium TaxID=2052148 RepID=A0A937XEP3_UNCW3|nr:hypothetical protein [candidate division WOR-3 bacterium]